MEFLHFHLCILLVFTSLLVAFSTNPINSVIFLIVTFCNAAFILFFFNIEFLGLIFIIIYVGAIAVLFLFVIMMLNIKSQEKIILKFHRVNKNFIFFITYYIIFLFLYFFFEIVYSKENFFLSFSTSNTIFFLDDLYNIDSLAQVLFNSMNLCFLTAGLILLIALIGSIVLTLKFTNESKNQLISKQLSRSSNVVIFLNKFS